MNKLCQLIFKLRTNEYTNNRNFQKNKAVRVEIYSQNLV